MPRTTEAAAAAAGGDDVARPPPAAAAAIVRRMRRAGGRLRKRKGGCAGASGGLWWRCGAPGAFWSGVAAQRAHAATRRGVAVCALHAHTPTSTARLLAQRGVCGGSRAKRARAAAHPSGPCTPPAVVDKNRFRRAPWCWPARRPWCWPARAAPPALRSLPLPHTHARAPAHDAAAAHPARSEAYGDAGGASMAAYAAATAAATSEAVSAGAPAPATPSAPASA